MDNTTVPELEYKSLGSEPLRDVVTAFLKERAEEGGFKVGGDGSLGSGGGGRGDGSLGGDDATTSSSPSSRGQSNNVVASGDTATTPSGGKCPFFRGSVGKSVDEKTTEEVVEETVKKVAVEDDEEEVASEDDDEEVARVAAAMTAGVEPWPTAGAGVAAASTPPSSWYHDADTAGQSIHTTLTM